MCRRFFRPDFEQLGSTRWNRDGLGGPKPSSRLYGGRLEWDCLIVLHSFFRCFLPFERRGDAADSVLRIAQCYVVRPLSSQQPECSALHFWCTYAGKTSYRVWTGVFAELARDCRCKTEAQKLQVEIVFLIDHEAEAGNRRTNRFAALTNRLPIVGENLIVPTEIFCAAWLMLAHELIYYSYVSVLS